MSNDSVYGSSDASVSGLTRKTRTHHLLQMKADGERWAMLTAYDYSSARIFEEAGIPVLLVGDSAANVVYGYDTTVPITIDELLPLVRGVVRGAPNALVVADAIAVQEAGAFSVVMEMVPADIAGQVTRKLTIPTIGIGAGNETDAQVLVWQDMAGYTNGKTAKFVKKFGNVGDELRTAAATYLAEVRGGVFPGPEHSY